MIHELQKGEQRLSLHVSKGSRISFWRPVSKVRYFHLSAEGVTTSQLPLFLSLSLYSKRKIQYLQD